MDTVLTGNTQLNVTPEDEDPGTLMGHPLAPGLRRRPPTLVRPVRCDGVGPGTRGRVSVGRGSVYPPVSTGELSVDLSLRPTPDDCRLGVHLDM